MVFMKLFMSSIPPPVVDSGGVNVDYGWNTNYPYRVDGVITYDQVGLDLGTLTQSDIDCATIDRTLSIIALSTGQRVQMYKTTPPSSPQQLRLENFYNGSYVHPDATSNSYAFVNDGYIAGANITYIAFSPNNYLWVAVRGNDSKLQLVVSGNVNSASDFSSFTPVTSVDFGSGTTVSIQFYGGYVYIARLASINATWIIERWDFTEPTPSQYASLTNNFNPETLGYFSNKQSSANLKGIADFNEALHGMYVMNNGKTLMVVVRGGGNIYLYDLSSNPYDITSSTITSSTPYLTTSSSQYYFDPNATMFPMSRAVNTQYNDVGQVTIIEEDNGDTPMFLIDLSSGGTTRDQQQFLALVRAERSGDPDPLTTIHLDFESANTYRVNTLYPSNVAYTQNTQYASVGSNCAYLDGTAGIEIQHDPQDGNTNYEEIYSFKHSFSGWFRFTSLSGTVPLLGTDYANHPRLLYDSTSNYISAHTLAVSSDREMRWNYTFSVDTWYHVCYALQSSNVEGMTLWINGTKITRTYVSTGITSLNENNRINYEPIMAYPADTTLKNQFIGRYVNTYMSGYVDDIRYYIGRIPDSYVQTLYSLKNPTVSSFTYTADSITITKSGPTATNWSWTLNSVSQGTVTGVSGTTQTITGLTLANGDVVVVTMTDSSVTETISGIVPLPTPVMEWVLSSNTEPTIDSSYIDFTTSTLSSNSITTVSQLQNRYKLYDSTTCSATYANQQWTYVYGVDTDASFVTLGGITALEIDGPNASNRAVYIVGNDPFYDGIVCQELLSGTTSENIWNTSNNMYDTNYSISMWMYLTDKVSTTLMSTYGSRNRDSFVIDLDSNGEMVPTFQCAIGGQGRKTYTSNTTLTTNTWHHWCLTISGSNMTANIYIDGQYTEPTSGSYVNYATPTYDANEMPNRRDRYITMGNRYVWYESPQKCYLSRVAYFLHTLTAEEVTKIYDTYKP